MIATRLREIREANGYTQDDLADLTGETPLQIWRWENNKSTPNIKTLIRLAKALNVSADFLLGLSDNPIPGIRESDLTPREKAVIFAMRKGEKLEAIRVITQE